MTDLNCCENEALYQLLLAELKSLEVVAPLSNREAIKYGDRAFKILMSDAIQSGQYSVEWLEHINQLSIKISDLLRTVPKNYSSALYNRLLDLQGDARQINPAECLSIVSPGVATQFDTISDQLAQGATLCQLF